MLEEADTQGLSVSIEAADTCHCNDGKTFDECNNVYHIEALDSRAATYEALNKLDHAMADAERILEMAPRRPDVSHLE